MPRRAVIMDRDGTVCEEVGYLGEVERVRLVDGSADAVRRINEAGFCTVIATNQSGVARGKLSEESVGEVHDRLRELLGERGARIDAIYYCPHHPEAGHGRFRRDCDCRKPRPGMLLRARDEMGVDLESSYVVGDSARDLEAGRRVGATTVLVLTGYGKRQLDDGTVNPESPPDHVAPDLRGAVDWILSREGPPSPAENRRRP